MAQDAVISEETFGCILDMPKARNTAKFDFVCEKGHGCAPLSIDDQQIADLQQADLRCTKK